MGFLENNLEEIIYKHPEGVRSRGLHIYDHMKVFRQLHLGAYGKDDLVGVDVEPSLHGDKLIATVYELKKDLIDFSTLDQATKYVVGLRRNISSLFCVPSIIEFHICLIGKRICDKTNFFAFMGNMGNLHAYTYDYLVDGVKFKDASNYHFTKRIFRSRLNFLMQRS